MAGLLACICFPPSLLLGRVADRTGLTNRQPGTGAPEGATCPAHHFRRAKLRAQKNRQKCDLGDCAPGMLRLLDPTADSSSGTWNLAS